ncbi:Inositolphosphorylceramide synthase subunit Kei1-domain-containing protein [Cercophora newfieldiana]|uniref:Inositolphosphorylceramide synthase subunit Kei1-domain-containing protein n=1 Tax=Cercophora newfieldiana TaxID=92897 RepID=A0AA39Y3S8_9PEZI|nr:Inositolphosphorylceramide synthase subunit Kei1-domain-containing protein [Cercophora newfieldiana]
MTAAPRGRCCWGLRLPRPKTFLGVISLQTGTELISLALLINKATGFYGFLTLLTGFSASALQVTWYTLSLIIIGALAYLVPHVHKQSPFQNLALAWLYVIDTFAHFAYVSAFATTWYLETVQNAQSAGVESTPERRQDGNETSGVVAPEKVPGNPDAAASMVLVVAFTLLRLYFGLVIMSYARGVLQRYSNEERGTSLDEIIANGSSPNPFAVGSALGAGLKGKMGRFMVSVGQGYWLGYREEDEEWARDVGAKFRGSRRGPD